MLVRHRVTAAERGVWPRRPTAQHPAATPTHIAFVQMMPTRSICLL